MKDLLAVDSLHAGYGHSEVLFGVNLSVGSGEIVGMIGRNGMGKTTLVRTVMGVLKPTAGDISFGGRSTAGLATHRIARLGLALVPEGRQVFPNLNVLEHLTAFHRSGVDGRNDWTPARVLDLFPSLAERRANLGNQLSGGEQQMLSVGRALVTNPRLLILDEATEGLAPLMRDDIWRALADLRATGHAMIVIDKYVQRLVGLADRCVIVEKGRIVWQGTSTALDADRALWQRYLGA